jgi:alkanesulfonate monooxygenase SsuD/methylene tetrahydromethanopterin reductase-like flavin-dependent oxidoreductase (luciferase family)
VDIGTTLPTMVGDFDRTTTLDWCRRIDAGPFASVAVGERVTFRNQEQMVMLSAAAALTSRVRIVATIVILPMHAVPVIAKQAATMDVLSGGRLTLGVGVGGREHDYRAAGASFDKRLSRLDVGVAELRRIWAGEPPFDGADPVGPVPVQPGGIPILCSSLGPKSLARSAGWADGFVGFTLAGDELDLSSTADRVTAAWDAAGRGTRPHLATTAWVSLGDDAVQRHRRYVAEYLAIDPVLGPLMVDAATMTSVDALRRALDNAERAGFDEFILVPTSSELAEFDRLEAVVASR